MLFKITLLASLLLLAAGRPQAPPPGQQGQQPNPSAPQGQANSAPPAGPQDQHAPGDHQPPATIVKNEFVDSGDGTFRWEFETSDGSRAEQTGHTINPGTDHEGEVIMGSYSYKAPDGQVISVTYVADQNGFQPMGAHLPTPPANPNSKAVSNSTAPGVPAPGAPAGGASQAPSGSPAAGAPAGAPPGAQGQPGGPSRS